MKVYIAVVVSYDTHYILGVYSTRNLAKSKCITWIHQEMGKMKLQSRRYREYYESETGSFRDMWKEDIDILQRILDTGDLDSYYGCIDTPRIEEWDII